MDNPLMCQFCQKSFSTKWEVMEHLRSHIVSTTSYHSIFYPETFSSDNDNDDHHKSKHLEKTTCDITEDKVPQEQDLLNSLKGDHEEKSFSCEICSENFFCRSQRDLHRRACRGLKSFECNICYKIFAKKLALEMHIRTHTGEKPFECDICNKRFAQKPHLDTHIRTHTGEKPFECEICKKKFAQKANLDRHIRTHPGVNPYECVICKKRFTMKQSLETHIKTHTEEKPYECDICKKRLTTKQVLERHTLTHTGEKPHECNICKKSFARKHNLDMHIRTHTGLKPFECDVCQKTFGRRQILETHIRTHTGVKPFECDICKENFAKRSNLNRHILTHTGEKRYECDICKKRFVARQVLQKHTRTHTGEKPFECDICKKRFAQKNLLDRHNMIHTGEKPHECDVCKKRFTRRHNLETHIRTHTGSVSVAQNDLARLRVAELFQLKGLVVPYEAPNNSEVGSMSNKRSEYKDRGSDSDSSSTSVSESGRTRPNDCYDTPVPKRFRTNESYPSGESSSHGTNIASQNQDLSRTEDKSQTQSVIRDEARLSGTNDGDTAATQGKNLGFHIKEEIVHDSKDLDSEDPGSTDSFGALSESKPSVASNPLQENSQSPTPFVPKPEPEYVPQDEVFVAQPSIEDSFGEDVLGMLGPSDSQGWYSEGDTTGNLPASKVGISDESQEMNSLIMSQQQPQQSQSMGNLLGVHHDNWRFGVS